MGVQHWFGIPGDFNLGLLDQLLLEPRLRMVGCCNELNAGWVGRRVFGCTPAGQAGLLRKACGHAFSKDQSLLSGTDLTFPKEICFFLALQLSCRYAADGYARATGLGCLVVTFGVGGLSALNAVAGAYGE